MTIAEDSLRTLLQEFFGSLQELLLLVMLVFLLSLVLLRLLVPMLVRLLICCAVHSSGEQGCKKSAILQTNTTQL